MLEKPLVLVEHVALWLIWQILKWFRLRNRQNICHSVSALLCRSLQVEERKWTASPMQEPQEKLHSFCWKPFPPSALPFTSGSYRAIEHSPGTSTSSTSETKSILKQHSPQFPHYFTCQMLTKQSWKAKCPSGAPQCTSCQPQPHQRQCYCSSWRIRHKSFLPSIMSNYSKFHGRDNSFHPDKHIQK